MRRKKPRFIIKALWSPDINPDDPIDDPLRCWVPMIAEIGESSTEGADAYLFYFTTPLDLADIAANAGYVVGRGIIVVPEFSWTTAERTLTELLEKGEEEFARSGLEH